MAKKRKVKPKVKRAAKKQKRAPSQRGKVDDLLVKLGSLIVHHEERVQATTESQVEADCAAIETLRDDPKVVAFFDKMNKQALLPVKRN